MTRLPRGPVAHQPIRKLGAEILTAMRAGEQAGLSSARGAQTRVLSLLAVLMLALAGCQYQDPINSIQTIPPHFYNTGAGGYWLVTKLGDTNDGACDTDCSLREAIAAATAGDEIRFGVTGTITLTVGTLQINKNLAITGPGAAQLTVSGDDAHRVFSFGAGVMASLSGLTIADGSADNGGGISKLAGTLALTDCVVRDNYATGVGGGIYQSTGTLTLTDCVVSGNTAGSAGGILSYGGGVISITGSTISGNTATANAGGMYAYLSSVTLERSTVSGNTAATIGGGIRLQLGSTTILNSTISGNTAGTDGGGIYRFGGSSQIALSTITNNAATTGSGGGVYLSYGALMDVKGSIIWGNTRLGATANDVGGVGYTSMGHNLIGSGSATTQFTADGDQTGVTDALLGTLQLNVPGTTRTHALLLGSPAINAGTCTNNAGAPVTSDQRGMTRPQGITCDIGAYELSPEEAVESLMEKVRALGPGGTGTLNQGQAIALTVSLDVVLKKLEGGQDHVALNNLRAFIDKVEKFVADGVLTLAEGQPLIDAAEQIIAAIEAT